jgi:hypothetical protein
MLKKLIILALFILYMMLGNKAFIFLLSEGWGLDSQRDLSIFIMYVFLTGCLISFFLAMLPAFIWPQKIWIWMIAYPFKVVFFGIMVSFSVIYTGNTRDLIAAVTWSSIGILMAGSSFAGAKIATTHCLKYRRAKT